MKKNYALLTGLILASSLGFAQNFANQEAQLELTEETSSTAIAGIKKQVQQVKAIGDTLYYQDFATQIPAGWVTSNPAGNSNNWIWANSAPGGQYSTTTAAINSTSAANGFLSLPADLYNTPFPTGGPIGMDAIITSPALTITAVPSIIIQWQQSQRYCCSSANELVLEVSTDNITWTTFDAAFGRNPNTAAPTPTSSPAEIAQINASAVLANATTVYVRFRSTGNSHYYWMIDDLLILEGAGNAMELEDYSINFSDTSLNPVLSIVPQLALDPLTFDGALYNAGSNTQTGVGLEVEVIQDSTYAGGPGFGVVSLQSNLVGTNVLGQDRDTVRVGTYVNTRDGFFRAIFRVFSDSVNQNPAGAISEQSFIVSDSVLAKDLGPYVGVAGPGNYVGGGNDGDRWGSLLSVGTNPATSGGIISNSISILVGNTTLNDGVSIQPRVWEWDDTASTIGNAIKTPPVGTTPFSTTIDTSMLGRWVTFPLFPPASITAGKQYVVGWEQTGGASNGLEFSAARDRNVEPFQQAVTNFVFVNDASPSWGWVTQVAAVRLNLNLTIGVEEKESTAVFSVYPNPNDGNFAVNISSNTPKTYTLSVRNMLGQEVYTNQVAVNGEKRHNLDLSGMDKGVYFVSLENGNERLVKKVILH